MMRSKRCFLVFVCGWKSIICSVYWGENNDFDGDLQCTRSRKHRGAGATVALVLFCHSCLDIPGGGPGNASDEGRQKDLVAERVIRVAVGGSENPSLTELVGPEDRLNFAGFFAFARREDLGVWPNFFHDVELIHCGFVIGRDGLGNRVVFVQNSDRIAALVLVMAAGHTEEFAPIIDFCGAVSVHGAVHDDGVDTIAVGLRDFTDVIRIVGIGEAFVVHDDIEAFGPVGLAVQIDRRAGSFASFEYDRPVDRDRLLFGGQLHGFGLVVVIVAATAGDDQNLDRLGGLCTERGQR